MHKYAIVTQAKDQAERLLPWFLYHYEQGFDTFVYFDDFSVDDTLSVIQQIKYDYDINILHFNTDNVGNKMTFQQMKNSNSYGGDNTINFRIIRSYNSGIKLLKSISDNFVTAFLDVDEFVVSPTGKVTDILEQNLTSHKEHFFIQSFDIDSNFNLSPFYISDDSTKMRWDYESRQKTIFSTRGKSIIKLSKVDTILQEDGMVHSIVKNSEVHSDSFVNHDLLRLHHFRKPSLDPKIELVEDTTLIDIANNIKQKYNLKF